ncbi:FadR/GntR family transcriptional regulator [Pseudonocardia eucalypti]|uniref:FadR/GntR family transcriptional regulator n=1 Tax=Pseudonocardia eucalypti TaxID=648755 RepID=A0ABP9PNW2_9PSEU|nr:DNA-binding FadR family transcriptional regulator [Pseudonocardia eucalypti]
MASSDTDSDKREPRIIGQKVVRPRAQVEQKIRAAIVSGELRGGERLPPEAELSRQFGVSRTTVREALRSLCAEGLITKSPGVRGGSFVKQVDHQSLGSTLAESLQVRLQLGTLRADEVAMVRQYLEVPAARLAAANRSARNLAALREVVAREKTIEADDPEVSELDARFHSTIAAASGNRAIAAFVHALHAATEPVGDLDLSPEAAQQTVRQHQAILAAIDAGDPDEAETAMVEHLSFRREHLSPAESPSSPARPPASRQAGTPSQLSSA